MSAVYFYCPECGYYETYDPIKNEIMSGVETHCGKCNAEMITRCPNRETCVDEYIVTLKNKYHKCGTELPNIEKANQRYQNSRTIRQRPC